MRNTVVFMSVSNRPAGTNQQSVDVEQIDALVLDEAGDLTQIRQNAVTHIQDTLLRGPSADVVAETENAEADSQVGGPISPVVQSTDLADQVRRYQERGRIAAEAERELGQEVLPRETGPRSTRPPITNCCGSSTLDPR